MERKDYGFTLIETLVSMMIFAIAGTMVLQLFSGGLKSAKISDDYTKAVFRAREKMEEILSYEKFIPGRNEGSFDDGLKFRYEIQMIEMPKDDQASKILDVYLIKLSILWFEGKREKKIDIQSTAITEKSNIVVKKL